MLVPQPFSVLAFYKFLDLSTEDLTELQKEIREAGERLQIHGLFLIAPEGMNATVAGSPEGIDAFQKEIERRFGSMTFKRAGAERQPFRRWSVKIRKEIVALGKDVHPQGKNNHLSPTEWNQMLREDVVVIDARNAYETDIGMFEGAVDPKISVFSEFPDYVAKSGIPKDTKVMLYCTGGIRCEKATIEMQKQGYEHVYQLDGGILKYLEEFPEGSYNGECFVFDHRVAVDKHLQPSAMYKLCPHCGDPGDVSVECPLCFTPAVICMRCHGTDHLRSCSKNCAYHMQRKKSLVSA